MTFADTRPLVCISHEIAAAVADLAVLPVFHSLVPVRTASSDNPVIDPSIFAVNNRSGQHAFGNSRRGTLTPESGGMLPKSFDHCSINIEPDSEEGERSCRTERSTTVSV